jgi:hypothetical protein
MHLLGTGDTDLAQIESLVKVSELRKFPMNLIYGAASLGRRKVCAADVCLPKRQAERRGTTPGGESAVEVLRGTVN